MTDFRAKPGEPVRASNTSGRWLPPARGGYHGESSGHPVRPPSGSAGVGDARTIPEDIYVIEGPRGWTEAFNSHQIELLERCGLIRHVRDGHVIQDADGNGLGPLHRYYREAF